MVDRDIVPGHYTGKLYRSGSGTFYLGVYTLGGEPQLIDTNLRKLLYNHDDNYQNTTPRALIFESIFPALYVRDIRLPVVGEVKPDTKRPNEIFVDDRDSRDMLDGCLDVYKILVVLPLHFDRHYTF